MRSRPGLVPPPPRASWPWLCPACCGLLAALVVGSSGCGGRAPSRLPNVGEPVVTAAPPAPRPAGPIAVALNGEPTGVFRTEAADRAEGALELEVVERLPRLGLDPCLERAARAYAGVQPELAAHLPMAFVEHVLHWAGCPDPSARVLTASCPDDDVSAFVDWLTQALEGTDSTAIGVAQAASPPPMRWRRVAFVVGRKFELRPVPVTAPPGTSLILQLRVDPSYTAARVYVIQPRGRMREYPVGLSGGWAVASVPLAPEIGRQWVELMAEAARGPEVLALFPIEVGREPSRQWVGEAKADESDIGNAAQAEELIAGLVARERARFELRELERDARLDQVARAYSEEMAASGTLAHVSKASGAINDRLETAGYGFRWAAENLAQGTSLVDAHEALLRSPGHRAAMLSPAVTRLGVGVARRETPAAGSLWFITQIFVRPLEQPSGE